VSEAEPSTVEGRCRAKRHNERVKLAASSLKTIVHFGPARNSAGPAVGLYLYRWRGKPTEMGLGSARVVSLAQARAAAGEARALAAQGINPLEIKCNAVPGESERRPPTFGEIADAFLDGMDPSWRTEKRRSQWEMSLGRRAALESGRGACWGSRSIERQRIDTACATRAI
jgi:hypothetical protein